MYEKQAFFKLDPSTQIKLRSVMALLSIIQILFSLVLFPSESFTSKAIGIIANLFILYFSLKITQAPNFYFQLFPWVLLINVVFNGMDMYYAISTQQLFTGRFFYDVICIILVVAIAPLIYKHRQYVAEAKQSANTPSQK